MATPNPLAALLPWLSCLGCGANGWSFGGTLAVGRLSCRNCGASHSIRQGVLQVCERVEDATVSSERTAVRETERVAELGGINGVFEDLSRADGELKEAILALPYGNESRYYREAGYFANVRAFAPPFDYILRNLGCPPGGRVLDVGADLTWSTAVLASRGFEAVAIDINHHLDVARIFQERAPPYAVVNVDMHAPLFAGAAFDAITAFNVLHHTGQIGELAANLARMLKPGGRLGFVEPYCLHPAEKTRFGVQQKARGINEHVYLLEEWHQAFTRAGLALVTFLLTDAFNAIYRKPPHASEVRVVVPQGHDDLFARYYDARLSIAGPGEVAVRAGAVPTVPVAVTNDGQAAWASEGALPIHLSYHLSRVERAGLSLVAFDNPRARLPGYLEPGHTLVLPLGILAPSEPGRYVAEIDLVQEGRTWFTERGVRPARLTLDVTRP
jgi:SAM-dependent methyltransferase